MIFFRNKWEGEDGTLVPSVLPAHAGANEWQSNIRAEELFRVPLLLCGLLCPSPQWDKVSVLGSRSLCGLCTSFPQAGNWGGLEHLHHDGQSVPCSCASSD